MKDAVARWQHWRPAFLSLVDPRFYTPEWLDAEIASERIRMIEGDRAAILVTIRTYPTGAAEIHGMAAAGDLSEIVDALIPRAEAWGRAIGCVVATIDSREGWARVLKPRGYAVHQVCLRKEL
jgi:hypothetical protein